MNKDIMADLALKELLVRLMQTQAGKLIENDYKTLKTSNRLAFIIDYIKNNLHQKLSMEHLAKLAFVSKSNFFKLFKYELGTSPNEYILQQRIKRAKELLQRKPKHQRSSFCDWFFLTPITSSKPLKLLKELLRKIINRNLFSEYKIVS